jgi:hypothetical protein
MRPALLRVDLRDGLPFADTSRAAPPRRPARFETLRAPLVPVAPRRSVALTPGSDVSTRASPRGGRDSFGRDGFALRSCSLRNRWAFVDIHATLPAAPSSGLRFASPMCTQCRVRSHLVACLVGLCAAGGELGCSIDTSEPEHQALERWPTCDLSGSERLADVVEDACGCLAPELTDVVVASCMGETTKATRAALSEQFRTDCGRRMRSCRASLEAFRTCADAAERRMADECTVPYLDECLELATAPGCALFVGCPDGWTTRAQGGVTSCKPNGDEDEASES